MGRGNQDKRRLQAAHGGKGFIDASDLIESKKRARRPTREQPPPTLPNVDVPGLIFAVFAIVFVVYPLAQWALGL